MTRSNEADPAETGAAQTPALRTATHDRSAWCRPHVLSGQVPNRNSASEGIGRRIRFGIWSIQAGGVPPHAHSFMASSSSLLLKITLMSVNLLALSSPSDSLSSLAPTSISLQIAAGVRFSGSP